MSLDVAVVSHGAAAWLRNLLASLEPSVRAGLVGTVHVWENASPDESPAVLERFARTLPVRVHRSSRNLGHGPALDALLREHVRARAVLVLDSDAEVVGDLTGLGGLDGEVFAGQAHPDPPQLYAYLCHLLLDREAYLALPPFSAGGAPGLAFFGAVEERGLPWRRLPFRGHVRHYGQGSLRALVRRGERDHPLHAFAAVEVRRDPSGESRAALELELEARLRAFLAGGEPPPLGPWAAGFAAPAAPAEAPRAARPLLPARLLPAARLGDRARRLGLGLPAAEARALAVRLRAERPARLLEVGTRHGGGLFLASRTAARRARLVTVDLPDWELDDPGEASKRARTEALVAPPQELRLRRGDPAAPESVSWAEEALGGPADLLLLDARRLSGRSEAAARWARLVRAGGLVAVTGGPRPPDPEVVAAIGGERGAGGDPLSPLILVRV